MKKKLPEDFINLRRQLLGDEWDSFMDSYQNPKTYGLRCNPMKNCDKLPFQLEQVPWTPEGFYANPEEHPGKHPLHEAGVYYIQEPSAMSVISLLDPKPGETICDLCAAPGGKSTHIAGCLQGQGLLVSNEIFPNRAKILSQNIERMGFANALVCNEPPDRMADFFPLFFDRIAVDAPCSGEGMFRKDDTAIQEWSPENISLCTKRQRTILNCADNMLKPGGIMVYSTCTFAPEENEEMIAWFLATHPDYTLEDWKDTQPGNDSAHYPDYAGLCSGKPEYVNWENLAVSVADGISPSHLQQNIAPLLTKTLRLWPHKSRGEGHFAARLRKAETPMAENGTKAWDTAISDTKDIPGSETPSMKPNKKKKTAKKKRKRENPLLAEAIQRYEAFQKDFLLPETPPHPGETISLFPAQPPRYELFGEELYQLPSLAPPLSGIKIVRAGLHLGTSRKKRFEPSYALAKALSQNQARQFHNCTYEEAVRYLKGETIPCDSSFKGWTLVCYQGFPLGWGKAQNGILKNHFPKGLRWN